MNKYLIQNYI